MSGSPAAHAAADDDDSVGFTIDLSSGMLVNGISKEK